MEFEDLVDRKQCLGVYLPSLPPPLWMDSLWGLFFPPPSGTVRSRHTVRVFALEAVSIITTDGKCLAGVLKGYDQVWNLVLDNCHERVYSPTDPVEEIMLGLYVIRGANVAALGVVDGTLDEALDLSTIRGEQLKPVRH